MGFGVRHSGKRIAVDVTVIRVVKVVRVEGIAISE